MDNQTDKRFLKSKLQIENAIEKIHETGKELTNISVSEIAKTANIARKTFYLHYVDLNDFINQFIREKVDNLSVPLREDADFNTCLTGFFVTITKLYFSNKLVVTLLNTPKYNLIIYENMKALIREFLINHPEAPKLTDLGNEFYASGIVSTFKYWITKLAITEFTPDLENTIRKFVENTNTILSNQRLI